MSTQDNKETARRLYEVMIRGNLDELDQYISNDMVDHNPAPGQQPGVAGVREALRQYRNAFSDMRIEGEDLIAEGDKVASRVTIHGKHTGTFQGTAPTGKEFSITIMDMLRFSGGKAVERWGVEDSLGLLTQLGAIPGMGGTGRRAA